MTLIVSFENRWICYAVLMLLAVMCVGGLLIIDEYFSRMRARRAALRRALEVRSVKR